MSDRSSSVSGNTPDRSSGEAESCWLATCPECPASADFPPLTATAETDVCIVGAGIAGLSTAYLLLRAGRAVMVLDDGAIGSGESSRTTAHLVSALDDRYYELERLHGPEGAQLAAHSHATAIDLIEAIVHDEGIDCDFIRLPGYLFVPPDTAPSELEQELQAARRAGLKDVEMVARAPMADFDTGPCLRFPRQGQFHPMRYLAGLARAIRARGGIIHCRTHVSEIEGRKHDKAPIIRTQDGAEVRAQAVVVATNTPVNDTVAIHTKQAPYRTFVIGLRIPAGAVTRALFWDTPDPYHYVRTARGTDGESEILVVGGEDHKTGQADDAGERFARLEAWARERFPMAAELQFRWSGQVMEPVDRLAFIGADPGGQDGVFIATGDSGNGMTHGTIAGLLLTDLITGRPNPWVTLYNPRRLSLHGLGEYASENLNVLRQYGQWLKSDDDSDEALIPPGSGAIVQDGLGKLAVYRDEGGDLHRCKAQCPHLGCIVSWNSLEKTWDCPCHGSRFEARGRVINGPANSDLEPVAAPGT